MSLTKNQIISNLKQFLMEEYNTLSQFWVSGKVLELINRERIVGEINWISLYVDEASFQLFCDSSHCTSNLSKDTVLWLDVNDYPIKLFKEIPECHLIGKCKRVKRICLSDIDTLFVKSYDYTPIV